jgi:GntR family transcriptional regulator/MocR family aminotransferase
VRTGQRLPSSRSLAVSLGVSRSTVVDAYERLKNEGYVAALTGSGTAIASIPVTQLEGQNSILTPTKIRSPRRVPSAILTPGLPDVSDFPHAVWGRCLAARGRSLKVHDLGYDNPCGIDELREAILEHIAVTRGIVARSDQILIVPSTRAAIDLMAQLLVSRQHEKASVAWIEEPGYPAAQSLLRQAGAHLVPVPCDHSGIDIDRVSGPHPTLIYVTPSHQYPTGATMALPRRLALLDMARANNAIILEDDYDSEFQYDARPIAALQGIDRSEVVAYLGTFSKVLAPGLRVAYCVIPSRMVADASTLLEQKGMAVPIHIQAALADFIREGRLRAYLRQMNTRYSERMEAMISALTHHCRYSLNIADASGGLQLATWFQDVGVDDQKAAQSLNDIGYGVLPMSQFYLGKARPGLLFGISTLVPNQADSIASKIASVLSVRW